jgi:uncharacterized protein YbcI
MSETHATQAGRTLAAVSSMIVKLHKEQFGRGQTHARSDFAGRDTLVCTLEDALLPAERAMVESGATDRVRSSRSDLQAATADVFIRSIEEIVGRKVRAFASAVDPPAGVVFEVFALHSEGDTRTDGRGPVA